MELTPMKLSGYCNAIYSITVLFGSITLLPGIAQAQNVSPAQIERSLSLRDNWINLTRNLMLEPQWAATGHSFHYKLSVEGGFMFYRDTVAAAKPEPAFDHQLISQALSKATGQQFNALQLPFDSFRYSDNGQQIQFYYDNQSWQCQLNGTACDSLTRQNQPKAFGVVRDLRTPAHNPARKSPDAAYQAQVIAHNLVVTAADGTVKYQSQDGSAAQFYDAESIRWAPDSSALLVMKVKPGTARFVTRVLSSPQDQLEPKTLTQLYPKPGDAVDIDQPVLLQLKTAKATQIDNQLFSQPYMLDNVQWQADSSRFTFRYTERGHQLARIIAVDAKTAQPKALLTERSNTFIDQWSAFYQPLQTPEQGFIWLSEQDGWAHLYWYNKDGKLNNPITKGDWRIREVLHIDEQAQQLWFAASGMHAGQDPYFVHYYRINFDGSGLTALTSANADHQLSFSADRQYYIDLYSRVDLPNVAELRRSSDGKLLRTLAKADISHLTQAGFKAPQPFVAKGRDGKTDIWGLIVTPQNFNPKLQYPVIENIYAGPHDSFVPKSFWPFGFHSGGDKVIGMQALADLGFVVVQIDGMGTSNRSKAFHDVAWQNLADSGFPDRILWHQAAAQQFPWYNMAAGVGIYGASAGGQSTVAALLFHPDVYTTGVAFAGCYDNRMDKISWNEQWMGYPVGPHYAASSVTEHAAKLQGQLLIINGEQDSNVDPASTMQLVNALISADKDFDLLLVPGGEHSTGRSSGPVRYIQRRQFDFFLRHLQQQQTPDWNTLGSGQAAKAGN
jgi:dipeptidyl aminopeptidase/acylaminoacyl peptidase